MKTLAFLKRAPSGPMDRVEEASLVVAGLGVAGNADHGGWRQITIIDEDAWRDAVAEVGVEVDFAARRANVLLRGIDLERSRGKVLHLGETAIYILGETRPCELMNERSPVFGRLCNRSGAVGFSESSFKGVGFASATPARLTPPNPLSAHLDDLRQRHHDACMRTTLTLDDDVAKQLREEARRSGRPFKAVVNELLRRGFAAGAKPGRRSPPFRVRPSAGGFRPGIDLSRLNQLVDEMDLDQLSRRRARRRSG